MAAFLMQLAFIIAIPSLFIALALSVIYEREICVRLLDWLQERRWNRIKPSHAAIARLVEGNRKVRNLYKVISPSAR
jgi:hypothetical protein